MKIVSICGSHRKHGNTETLLKGLEKEFTEIIPDIKHKILFISDMNIYPCISCMKYIKKDKCVIDDDFEKIATKMLQSDLIILGSPVYFSDVSAQVKALIDRTFSLWHKKLLKGKKVILVAACADSGTGHTIDTMRHWALEHEMDVLATIEGRSEKKGAVLEDQITMKSVKDAVREYALIQKSQSKKHKK
jgi:multimeric flavodoxin WrbA